MVDFASESARLIAELRSNGTAPGIEVGETAPRFTLPDTLGIKVSLDQRLGVGPVVLSFYRGAWCPICNAEVRAQQAILPEIRALGASLIAISPQSPDKGAELSNQLDLGFDVLSDADQSVIRSYRLQFELPESLRPFYVQFGFALDEQNVDGSWRIPVPATFVLDRRGIVRARHVDPDYTQRMEPARILQALKEL